MKLKKILACALSLCCMFSVATGCGNSKEKEEVIPKLPEYSQEVEPIDFFTYTAPLDGYRTVERYREYKEAGLNILMLTGSAAYLSDWENSESKMCFENAYEAGIDRIILTDNNLQTLVGMHDDDGKSTIFNTYTDEEGLKNYVKSLLEVYYQMPGFYGVNLRDEPNWKYTESFGQTYKAVRAAAKELGIDNIYIHMNLLPLGRVSSDYAEQGTYTTFEEAYSKYIRGYLEATGADRMSVDIYAFRSGFYAGFFPTLKIVSRECKALGVDWTYCLQSFEEYSGTSIKFRKVGKSEMLLELNTMLGLGVDSFAYYTYFSPKGMVNSPDGSFINKVTGEKTSIYYWAQECMAYAQKMQKVLAYYDYKGMRQYTSDLPNFNNAPYLSSSADSITNDAIVMDNTYEFALLKGLEIDNDIAFVTELKDEENDLYMYMLQNVINPINGADGETAMTVTADFGSEYKYAAVYEDGDVRYVKLNNGKYSKILSAGYAVYVIPLK